MNRWLPLPRRRALLLSATALLLAACSLAQARSVDDDSRGTLRIDGQERTYLVHVPAHLPAGPRPLLLMFHGGGGRDRGMVRLTGIEPLADRAGVIVVYPQGLHRHWNDGRASIKDKVDDVGFVRALLDRMEREHAIDRSRIGAAGISNGAIFVERLGCDLSGRISAIVAVAGTLASDYRGDCRPAHPVSVLQFDGDQDPIMPYAGGHVADFGGRGEGGNVLSVDATTAFWSGVDGCRASDGPDALPVRKRLDPTRVARTGWRGCREGSAVTLYRIEGGGHTWPGGMRYLPRFIIGRTTGQIDASAVLLQFVLDHPSAAG